MFAEWDGLSAFSRSTVHDGVYEKDFAVFSTSFGFLNDDSRKMVACWNRTLQCFQSFDISSAALSLLSGVIFVGGKLLR